jgi:O-Antigen ligase
MIKESPVPLLPTIVLGVMFCAIGVMISSVVSNTPVIVAITLAIGFIVFFATLYRIEYGVIAFLLAMIFSPEFTIGVAKVREITLRLEDVLLIFLVVAYLVKRIVTDPGPLLQDSPLTRPIVAFFALACLSTAMGVYNGSVDKSAIFYLLKMAQFFLIFFFISSTMENDRQLNHYLVFLFITCFIVSLYGLWQIAQPERIPGVTNRISAPFEGTTVEPNTFGGYLTIIICMALCVLIFTPNPRIRVLSSVLCVVATISLLFTLSRASFIGFFGAITFISFASKKVPRPLVAIALFFFLVGFKFLMPEDVAQRVNYTFTSQNPVIVKPLGLMEIRLDSSTAERIGVWIKVFHKVPRRPLIGYGVTHSNIQDSQFARYLIEVGLLGTAAFLWILYTIWKMAWKVFHDAPNWLYRAFALGYIAAFLGTLLHSMGTITFYIVRIMEPFWFLTGILAYMWLTIHYAQQREEEIAHQGQSLAVRKHTTV